MSNVVSEVEGVSGGNPGDGFEALVNINDGFLGTGFSTSVEISFLMMALIATYVAISTARYFLHGTRVVDSVAEALGLNND